MARSIQHMFSIKLLEHIQQFDVKITHHTHWHWPPGQSQLLVPPRNYAILTMDEMKQIYKDSYESQMGKPHSGKFFNGPRWTFEKALENAISVEPSFGAKMEGNRQKTFAIDIDELKRLAV